MTLHAELDHVITAGRAVVEKARQEGRELTPSETATAEGYVAKARSLSARIKAEQSTLSFMSRLGYGGTPGVKAYHRSGGPSEWVRDTTAKIDQLRSRHGSGSKALLGSSALTVTAPADASVTSFPEAPVRILDLIADRQPLVTNAFSYFRQTVRTNNAAPVADEGLKPTSVFTFVEIEDRARVFAHLSEPVVDRLFDDAVALTNWLRVEMELSLLVKLEAQIVSGDGVGENLTGILNTSGVRTQAFSTDPHSTIRKARTTLAVNDEAPTAVVVHPADAESFDLAREGANGGYLLAEGGQIAGTPGNVFGNLALVQSVAVPVGTALVGDFNQVRLMVRQEARIDIDRSGNLFQTNRAQVRCEARYGVAMLRPGAFCRATLTGV